MDLFIEALSFLASWSGLESLEPELGLGWRGVPAAWVGLVEVRLELSLRRVRWRFRERDLGAGDL